jgi:hypothetical protein
MYIKGLFVLVALCAAAAAWTCEESCYDYFGNNEDQLDKCLARCEL